MNSPEQKKAPRGLARHLRRRLVSGVLLLVPLAITLFILNLIFNALTAFALPLLRPWLGEWPEYALVAVALAVTFALIYLVGLIATHIIGRRIIQFGEAILLKLPIVKSVYSASKQVVNTFSASTAAAFQSVVLVEFPRTGSLAVGFVTGTILDPGERRLYRVFVPTTPNPTSGFLVLLPAEQVRFTDISVEDGVKMIVSGGMLSPERYAETPPPAAGEVERPSSP
ncbi:MAG TPA: DUF502 domain-containing protein [Kiritimatiellia bacterium]|nr:DUF502 domain-containing protein [Kiritimatiellia bacterium]HRZ11021.1 DUF502 domain-containing protein [Kiritimatiellia bacterium]HSA18594.1 DUF502 domain-containing protein [Kiritimatiellia bacterium]